SAAPGPLTSNGGDPVSDWVHFPWSAAAGSRPSRAAINSLLRIAFSLLVVRCSSQEARALERHHAEGGDEHGEVVFSAVVGGALESTEQEPPDAPARIDQAGAGVAADGAPVGQDQVVHDGVGSRLDAGSEAAAADRCDAAAREQHVELGVG